MQLPDPQRVSVLIEEAAAAEIVPRFRNLATGDVREKSPGEVVTAADEAMERRLEADLQGLLPGSVVVGEESAAADPRRLELLNDDRPAWVIDPLDGTANFAAGIALFGSMVCLVRAGETLAAWIHLPVEGRTLVAERGSGAWLGRERLHVGTAVPPYHASISTKFFPSPQKERIQSVLGQFACHESSHCAAVAYRQLVTGELDVALYYRLMPWDHAPGVLIHAEAGGYSARLNGEPYSPLIHSEGLLVAPSEEAWQSVMQMIGERPAAAS
ncbi:MAG: inositol monophosphatase [Dehalococcoidia bacterium]